MKPVVALPQTGMDDEGDEAAASPSRPFLDGIIHCDAESAHGMSPLVHAQNSRLFGGVRASLCGLRRRIGRVLLGCPAELAYALTVANHVVNIAPLLYILFRGSAGVIDGSTRPLECTTPLSAILRESRPMQCPPRCGWRGYSGELEARVASAMGTERPLDAVVDEEKNWGVRMLGARACGVALQLGQTSNAGGGCFNVVHPIPREMGGIGGGRSSSSSESTPWGGVQGAVFAPAPALFCDTTALWAATLMLHVVLLWLPISLTICLRSRSATGAADADDPEARHGHTRGAGAVADSSELPPLARLPRPIFYAIIMTFGFWYVAGFSGDMEEGEEGYRGSRRHVRGVGVMRALMESSMQHFLCGIPYALVLFVGCASFSLPRLDTKDRLLRTACLYHLPFLLGLHLNMARYFLPDVSMGAAILQAPSVAAVALFVTIVCATLALLAVQVSKIRRARLSRIFLAGYAGLLLVLIALSVFASSLGLSTHFHHSFWPLLVIPATAFRDPTSMVAQAFLTGIVVNGVATYGVESQWERLPHHA